jgi:hypothetical protein
MQRSYQTGGVGRVPNTAALWVRPLSMRVVGRYNSLHNVARSCQATNRMQLPWLRSPDRSRRHASVIPQHLTQCISWRIACCFQLDSGVERALSRQAPACRDLQLTRSPHAT